VLLPPTLVLQFNITQCLRRLIDADKDSYPAYLDWCLRLVRPGGPIVADNVLRRGEAVDTMNRSAASDPRLEALILPVRDGADGILVGVVRGERHS
jgi:predicted O-methyltransferase YrrM